MTQAFKTAVITIFMETDLYMDGEFQNKRLHNPKLK